MANVLLITSDQHNPFFAGYAGDTLVHTPTLDGLAREGVVFDAAYTNSPICMPARASLATGRYGSAIGSYDNGSPYHADQADSIGHRVSGQGRAAVTFGKLHFDADSDSGFDMRLPLQAKAGYGGAIQGWARGSAPRGDVMVQHALDAKPGASEYELYDRNTTASVCSWLNTDAPVDTPWFAHVSYAYPHYPFRAPAEFLPPDDAVIPLPPAWQRAHWPHNAELDAHRRLMGLDDRPLTEDEIRQLRWIYAAMVNFVDAQVAEVLAALDGSGQRDDTVVIYTSDHGDMLGSHGFLMKSLMYDASARVPMIMRGPGIDPGRVCSTAVSLVDVFPTAVSALGCTFSEVDADLPGVSLIETAGSAVNAQRAAFSEYHGPASSAASYMIRSGKWKYVRHLYGDQPAEQLFDMANDPDELHNVASDDSSRDVLRSMEAELRLVVNPETVDAHIRAEQAQRLNEAGGLQPRRGSRAELPRTPLGTIAVGWSVPSPEIMAQVTNR